MYKYVVSVGCSFSSSDYEEWDDDEDMRWILTFKILDEFDIKPKLN